MIYQILSVKYYEADKASFTRSLITCIIRFRTAYSLHTCMCRIPKGMFDNNRFGFYWTEQFITRDIFKYLEAKVWDKSISMTNRLKRISSLKNNIKHATNRIYGTRQRLVKGRSGH
jgi:hypothetical protein